MNLKLYKKLDLTLAVIMWTAVAFTVVAFIYVVVWEPPPRMVKSWSTQECVEVKPSTYDCEDLEADDVPYKIEWIR